MIGYDHYGDDITQLSGATLQALATACNASPYCYAFNWSPYSYMASGYLKTTGTSVSVMAGMCFYKWTSEQGLLWPCVRDLGWQVQGHAVFFEEEEMRMQDLGVRSVPGQFVSTWAEA